MGHCSSTGGTVRGVLGQGGRDHPADPDREGVGERRWLLVDVGQGGRHHGAGVERTFAGEHLVPDNAKGVDVAGGGRTLPHGLLGGEVLGGSDDAPGLGQGRGVSEAGDAEVRELGGAVGCDQDVGRLDVAVDDAAPMGDREGGGGLDEYRRGLLR